MEGFYNIGWDSLNCNCCNKNNLNELLPNSLVEIEFLSEGLYFEPIIIDWALEFHNTKPFKEKRIKKMREWFYSTVPLGPFSMGQKEKIPLIEAKKLLQKNQARIIKIIKPYWFCKKNESILSKQLKELNALILELNKIIQEIEKASLNKNKLAYTKTLNSNPFFNELLNSKTILVQLFSSISNHLCNQNSLFFSKDLSMAVKGIQATILNKLSQVLEKKGSRLIAINNNKVLIQSNNTLLLLKEFSKTQGIPMPKMPRLSP
jgi:DNA polymerase elongation subunit (family B)